MRFQSGTQDFLQDRVNHLKPFQSWNVIIIHAVHRQFVILTDLLVCPVFISWFCEKMTPWIWHIHVYLLTAIKSFSVFVYNRAWLNTFNDKPPTTGSLFESRRSLEEITSWYYRPGETILACGIIGNYLNEPSLLS